MYVKFAFLLASLAGSALAQSTQLTLPRPGSNLTVGNDVIVQVGIGGYPENVDVVAIVIGLAPCYGGKCYNASSFLGNVLYQGPYTPLPGDYYANYSLTVPEGFTPGNASLNLVNFFLVGAEYVPVVEYLNLDVRVVAPACGPDRKSCV